MTTFMVKLDPSQMVELAGLIAQELKGDMGGSSTKPYTVELAAKALGVSQSTIQRRIKANEIPTIPGLGKTLIPASAIADLLDGKRPKLNQKNDE